MLRTNFQHKKSKEFRIGGLCFFLEEFSNTRRLFWSMYIVSVNQNFLLKERKILITGGRGKRKGS